MSGLFVTGTDTGIGKTWTALGLMHAYKNRGMRVAGMKPVASGARYRNKELVNDDALVLQQACDGNPPYAVINPYVFQPPVAPHIAARQVGVEIRLERLHDAYMKLSGQYDQVIVEGAGGWRVPLGEDLTMADLVKTFGIQVVVVVGLRLGCINHALLTVEAVRNDGLIVAGWVASHIDPEYSEPEQNVATLVRKIDAPLLGRLPNCTEFDAETMAESLDIGRIGSGTLA